MLCRSLIRLSASTKNTARTIVRDPRKKKSNPSSAALQLNRELNQVDNELNKPVTPPIPFAPSQENQDGVGSTLGSYVLAGVGVTMGFTLVKIILGV